MTDNQYLELTVGMEFSDVDALNEHRLAYSRQQNISIVTKKSDYKRGFISWKCKHGGVYRQAKGAMNGGSSKQGNQIEGRETKTFRMGCPYLVNIYRRQASKVIRKAEQWVITSMMDQHNHPLTGCLSTYVMNQKVVGDEVSHVDKLLASRGSHQVIISNCKLKFGDRSNLLAKDISNMRYRRTGVTEDPKARSMFNFISKLQEAGYDVRWAVNEKNELASMFFTHGVCIKQARRFSEVVIIDATYKTNRNKLPLVNMVGVDNVCRGKANSLTFAVAGGWISNETTESYTWLLKQLESSVFPADSFWRPAVFVTDQENALTTSIKIVFPVASTLLCYIHMMRNFKLKLERHFKDNDGWKKTERALYNMIHSHSIDYFEGQLKVFNQLVDDYTADKDVIAKAYLKRRKANLKKNSLMPVLGSEVKTSKVSNVYNPKGDGNCGFRCVAMAVFGDEEKYMDVKTKMLEKLREIKGDYEKSTWINKEDSFGKLEALLMNTGNCLHNRDFRFTDPVCSQLAADTFETPIEFHGPNHSTLYLPLTNHKYKSYRPVALNLHADHIYLVTMKKGTNYGYAPINMMHNSICEKLDLNNLSASFGQ